MYFLTFFRKILHYTFSFLCTLLLTAMVTFTLLNMIPGNAAQLQLGLSTDPQQIEALLKYWHLDAPFLERLFQYLFNLAQLDFGTSYVTGLKVSQEILSSLPNTFLLTLMALSFAIIFGVGTGLISAFYHQKWFDRSLSLFMTIIISLPSFVIGIILIQLFVIYFPYFSLFQTINFSSFMLPALTLGLVSTAFLFRTTRFSIIQSSSLPYVSFLKHYNIPLKQVYRKYLLKETFVPLLTLTSLEINGLLAGAFVVETLFLIPGMGQLLTQAISHKDVPTIMGGVIILSAFTFILQKLMEGIYRIITPYLQEEEIKGRFL